MRISRYAFSVRENSDDYLTICTLTRAVIRLNSQAKRDLEKGEIDNCLDLTKEQFQDCVEMGFLVPDELNENNFLGYILNKDRLSPTTLTTYIAISTICNFRCVYCYEAGQVEHQTMDKQTILSLIDWYKYKLEQGQFEVCSVDLYGGEPLLFKPLIITFLSRLNEITKVLGIKLEVRLITNGYFLKPGIVRKLLPFGLNDIHVTIDGSKEMHNKRRPLADKGDTFDVVFNNLLDISLLDLPQDFNIICRISFDVSNVKDIPLLLDQIKQRDKTGKIDPYFGSITQTTSQVITPESFCSQHVLGDKETAKSFVFLYKQAKKREFTIPDFFSLGPCMVIADNAVVIAPDGSMYKCLDMIGHKELAVGNIASKEFKPIYYDFMKAYQLEWCLSTDCPFVPVCGGGCVMEAYLKTGDYKKVICHRKMLEEIYSSLLPLQFSNQKACVS